MILVIKMSLSVDREWTHHTIPDLKDKSNNQQYQDKMLPFPYEIRNVDENLNRQIMKDFSGKYYKINRIPEKFEMSRSLYILNCGNNL